MAKGGTSNLAEISGAGIHWVHSTSADDATLAALRRRFHFSELDLREVRPGLQRPKMIARNKYLFMILLFPFYDSKTRDINISELDFFITKDTLVTVNHRAELPALRGFAAGCKDRTRREEYLAGGITNLLYRILQSLHEASFPMLVHISQDIDAVETGIHETKNPSNVEEILRIKMNLVDFRRAMQGHKPVIERLLARGDDFIETKTMTQRWNELLDVTKEIWTYLETQRETVNALHEAYTSNLSFRTNEIIKTLTIVSVLFLPLSLIATFFGMNYTLPYAEHPLAVFGVVALMATSALIMLALFKSKRWL